MNPDQTVPQQPIQPQIENSQFSFLKSPKIWPFIFLLALLIPTGIYFLGKSQTNNQNTAQTIQYSPTPTPTPTPISDPTANWKTYTNKTFGWQIKYPPELEAFGYTNEATIYMATSKVAEKFKKNEDFEGSSAQIEIDTNSGTMPTSFPWTNGTSKPISTKTYTGIFGDAQALYSLIVQGAYIQNPKGGYIFIRNQGRSDFEQILQTFKFTD